MILFTDLFVIIVGLLIVLSLLTEVIFPLLRGTPLFPFFHKSEVRKEIVKIEGELETVAEREYLQKVETELNSRKAELEKK